MSDFRDLILDSLQESGRMTNASVRLDSAVSELSLTLPHPLPSNWLDLLTVVTKVLPVDVNVSSNGVSFLPAAPGAEARMPNSDDRPPPFSFSAWGENGAGDSVRVKCHLSNLTPDDWFVAVDENGRIAPLWLPANGEDAKADDAPLAPVFDILEELPQNVRWVAWIHPTHMDGRTHSGEDFMHKPDFIRWKTDLPDGERRRGSCFIRALNGSRWTALGRPEESLQDGIPVECEGLRWNCEWSGTNLILTVENETNEPRLLCVWPQKPMPEGNACEDRKRERLSGPFPLSVSIRDGTGEYRFDRWPQTAMQGVFRVLHGKSALSEARMQSFSFEIPFRHSPIRPGASFACDMELWPRIICPRAKVVPSNDREKAMTICMKKVPCRLRTVFVVDENGTISTVSTKQEVIPFPKNSP